MYVVICELCDVAAVVVVAVAVADERLFVTIGQAGPFFASFPPVLQGHVKYLVSL